MRNFLLRCFQKNPEERASSKELQQHEWIIKNLKTKQKSMFIYRQTKVYWPHESRCLKWQ